MATVVQDFGQSKKTTVFHGSSEDDIAYAKAFWQSMNLLPPMESRLVSSDIKQRLKKAPSSKDANEFPVNKANTTTEEFLAVAAEMDRMDRIKVIEKFSNKREEHIHLLQKHRQARIEKEKVSKHKGVHSEEPQTQSDDTKDDYTDEIAESIQDIDQFEKQLNHYRGEDCDSD